MSEGQRRQRYLSYLVRLWQVSGAGEGEGAMWRASVEHVQGGERVSFASLDELFEFLRLQAQLASSNPSEPTCAA